jgi:tRNA-splicing ligase RtcB (3'-phosphate/5'-hydroxy nucleic acid ligase)
MPDVHWGMGATVGSVIPTVGAIIPAAVGVEIGCGMMAVRTGIKAEDLPDNLHTIRFDIEAKIPHGRTDIGGPNDRGAWGEPEANDLLDNYFVQSGLSERLDAIVQKHPGISRAAERDGGPQARGGD